MYSLIAKGLPVVTCWLLGCPTLFSPVDGGIMFSEMYVNAHRLHDITSQIVLYCKETKWQLRGIHT
jgi:hypothetical protein